MTSLSRDFEDDLREALLSDAEDRIQTVADRLVAVAEEQFRAYANRNGYDIEHIWQDVDGPEVTRSRDGVTAYVQWPGLTALFEFGVDPHTIEGDPVLAFYWAGPPEGTRPPGAPSYVVTDSVNWGSVTGGIPEARAIRHALDVTRQDLRMGETA
jgi:hypothetical protein